MSSITKNFFVVAGGDGSGKSTVLAGIERKKGEKVEIVSSHYFHPLLVEIFSYCGILPNPSDFERMMCKMPRLSLSILLLLLESMIIDFKMLPAIKRGKMVIADCYFYKILAREIVRKRSFDWVRYVFSQYPIPEKVFFIKIDPAIAYFRKNQDVKESECGVGGKSLNSFVSFQSETEKEMIKLIQTVHVESELVFIDGNLDEEKLLQVILNSIQ